MKRLLLKAPGRVEPGLLTREAVGLGAREVRLETSVGLPSFA